VGKKVSMTVVRLALSSGVGRFCVNLWRAFRIGWSAAMLIETPHPTTPLPQTPDKTTSSLGCFGDRRLDKRGASFSMRSSIANPYACENWPPAIAPPKSGSAASSGTTM
jgi:hypothetical protein